MSSAAAESIRAETVVVEQKVGHKEQSRPSHHADDTKTRFKNPWPSFRSQRPSQWLTFFFAQIFNSPKVPDDLAARIPSREPDWGATLSPDGVKATWLGHASFLVELPTPAGAARGPRILFDPVLSHRCAPVQWAGPARLLPTPCAMEDVPEVDVICISHNHYDHMDAPTLRTIFAAHRPHVFAPLGNAAHLAGAGIAPSHVHILDWWDAAALSVSLPPLSTARAGAGAKESIAVRADIRVTCTPSQHTSNRGPFDRWHTLWSSWAVEDVPALASPAPARKVYFAGDTGYRTVREGEDEDTVPRCPAFAEIGRRFEGFDIALLPIGAYAPRAMWSNLHASPADAVEIFKDVRARKALAMHWGTWILTTEPTMEPPALMRAAAAKAGLAEGAFDVCGLGETRVV
ncbi:N-acyl-phosphatidylethanolamine-hydrolyzing phospholipase D [Trametes gibbosa]|nr:N-acyl-phosphatidylethanolamine-hydrolyzing phospholipase D [Trametes gibbosa]